ncbi:helix-turn-helix domain-containing protein [Spirosoma sp. HMF4905]|uniref:Helix-turn-helix domain-containing protein n=1 Tax=Spirosoma arboris TaxID=2682092 RepID=A0A7K1S6D5_9BACT|nr:helix-turn-helix transcriptional regulator [Spirosoma arboris]MVM29280.1 helix-turn-helix domain-containing protein [Spirosoma arboris]
MNTPEEIGDYIEQLRKQKGLTQAEMAHKLGVKTSTYTHFETGRTNMTLSTLNRISNALGYDMHVSFFLKKSH